jgi:adenine-specific DNA-methyltransferase
MESILKGLGTTSSAKDELEEIFGYRYLFQTPKPRKLIKELVRAATGKNAVVLDFFAGSGTTGHAVMDLNREDNGKRRFVLVTNNENDICRKITYERLKRALGKEKYEGSLKYFKINYRLKE